MKLLKFIPLQLVIALITGIYTGYIVEFCPQITLYILISVLMLFIIAYFKKVKKIEPSICFTWSVIFIFFLIGLNSISFSRHFSSKNHYTLKGYSEGCLPAMILRIDSELRSSAFHNKYESEVLQVNGEKTTGKILLNIANTNDTPDFSIGDKILVKAKPRAINPSKNPYQFDYKAYLERQKILRQLTLREQDYLVLETERTSLGALADQLRAKVKSALVKYRFADDELSIINALLLGQRNKVSKEIIENYQKAGAIHILAISGLHVGIILIMIGVVFKPLEFLRHGKQIRLLLSLVVLWAFAFTAGLSPSVVRAVTMFTAVAISFLGKRRSNVYNNLIISMFFLLLVRPMYLFDVGFQMSYLAVFFIVWLQPVIYQLWGPKLKAIDYLWKLFSVSLVAQIGVFPLGLYYFHQFPGLFFLTNLVIIPVLGLILGLGLIVMIFSLFKVLPDFLAASLQSLIAIMNRFIGWVASQERFVFTDISFSMMSMFCTYFFILLLFRWVVVKTPVSFKYLLFSLVLLQTVLIYEHWKSASKNEFIVFNKNRATIIANRKGEELTVYHSSRDPGSIEGTIKPYIIKSGISKTNLNQGIDRRSLYKKNILLIDSLGSFEFRDFHPNIVILTQSPKINLERLLQTLKPKMVIADNSNYNSYVKNWKATCKNYEISFHYTYENGAFIIEK